MKKLLAVLLTLAMCIPCFGAISFSASAEATEHVYMIVTNPGEDMNTQMNIGWHADYTYTGCYVEYTTADDTAFANAKKVEGVYDDDDYLWFMDRYLKGSGGTRFDTPFLNYGADLNGLTSDTDYIYRICDGEGGYSDTYAFTTAGQDEFSIMWLSDMHLSNDSSKATKYKASIDYVEPLAKYDIGLYFNTGDVVSCGDRYGYWQEYYNYDVMKKYTYAATVGNHDLYDSMMKDDSAYTDFWKSTEYFRIVSNYPDNGYDYTSGRLGTYLSNAGYQDYASESAGTLITVDSGSLAGKKITGSVDSTKGRAYWFIYNRVLFIVFDYFAMTYNSEAQVAFNWALEVVEQNRGKYDYLVATEHENLLWGGDGTSRYYDKYKNFLDTANVDIFFAGDNHVYFRSHSLVDGQINTDPEKGTYVLQAPAITNTSSYGLHSGAVGLGVTRYADADYLGGVMIDVDSEGMHLTVATATGDGSNYKIFEEITIPKKVRYADAVPGIYELGSELSLYETTDLTSAVLKTIPAGTMVEVYDADGIWGKIRYEGMSGWTRLVDTECLYKMDVPSTYGGVELNGGYNMKYTTDGVYAYTPAYGATIANGNWSFMYNYVYIAEKQSDGSYTITSVNKEQVAKKDTPTAENTVVIMADSKTGDAYADVLVEGYNFTLDWAQNALNSTDVTEEAPVYEFCTVTFCESDGTLIGSNKALKGHAANELKPAEIEGYTFTGWDKDISTITEDITVTAKYSINEYTVTFVGQDGTVISEETVIYGQAATAPEAPVVEGYAFTGWDKAFDAVTEDMTVTALYETARLLGDATGDGKVNSQDAAFILRYDADLTDFTDAQIAVSDVTRDGKVNSLDAAMVLRYDADLIPEF